MPREKWRCENTKCKTKSYQRLVQLNPGSANYLPYCITNKKTQAIDMKKVERMKANGAKWRCASCFNTFLKSNNLHTFYKLLEPEHEPNESNEPKETENEPPEEVNHVRKNCSAVFEDPV